MKDPYQTFRKLAEEKATRAKSKFEADNARAQAKFEDLNKVPWYDRQKYKRNQNQ